MSSSLTATKIKDSYVQLLHVDGGVNGTLKTVYDGDGTATALKVGTGDVQVNNSPVLTDADAASFATSAQGSKADTAVQPAAISNMLETSDIGVTVQGYDSTILKSSAIGVTVQAYDADLTTWSGKTAPTGDVVGTSDTQTLTNKTFSDNPTFSGGTANGVAYLNGSKVLTTGSALTFNGTSFGVSNIDLNNGGSQYLYSTGFGSYFQLTNNDNALTFGYNGSEQMRLTSTGLGIGTSSPAVKLDVDVSGGMARIGGVAGNNLLQVYTSSGATGLGLWAGGSSRLYSSGGLIFSVGGTLGTGAPTGYTDAATLDSYGNLGLGVTPSAWDGTFKSFQYGQGKAFMAGASAPGTVSVVGSNAYYNGAWLYGQTAAATMYQQNNNAAPGSHVWYTAPSGTAGNAISFTQAMTLDASGNLVVNGTSARSKLDVQLAAESAIYAGGTGNYSLRLGHDNTSGSIISINSGITYTNLNISSLNTIFNTGTSALSERMRIDSSGNLSVGLTSGGGRVNIQANSNNFMNEFFNQSGSSVGSIQTNGTTTSYVTSSDYRLKENIKPMQNALGIVAQLNPVTYNWKADGSDGQGFIAHELQAVVPDCVTGEKDAVDAEGKPVYQGIDTSFLVATLTKAIKEQQEQINQLKAEVATLKGA